MTKVIDFTNCPLSARNLEYGGRAGEKRGIVFNNEYWFLKFPKNTSGMVKVDGLSYVTSPLSEYIGSHIFELLGYKAHETLLGICNDGKRDKVVCACKDFIKNDKNEILIPYTALRNDTNPKIMDREYEATSALNINEIIFQLDNNTVLSEIPEAKNRFWETVVIDMLINNNDRNEDNWGVIKYKDTGKYELAPIYDCGNCFYGKTSDERIAQIMKDNDRLVSSAINGITAYEDDNYKRISFLDMIKINNKDFIVAKNKIVNKIVEKQNEIFEFINNIASSYKGLEIASDLRKRYYIETLKIRLSAMQQ